MSEQLFDQLKALDTEQRNPDTMEIDVASAEQIVELINQEDKKVAEFVAQKNKEIAQAVDLVSQAFSVGGRLLYFGAGTSGRLGVLDALNVHPLLEATPNKYKVLLLGEKLLCLLHKKVQKIRKN